MKKNLKRVSNIRRARAHGFLRRMRTRSGQQTLARRRRKGRWQLIPT